MIRVSKFIISSDERRHKQSVKDVEIIPQNSGVFEFISAGDMHEFMEELRQTFEHVFIFGCSVSAKMANHKHQP